MQILVNTDSNVEGGGKYSNYVESELASTFERFTNEISRIEVHLSDENGAGR